MRWASKKRKSLTIRFLWAFVLLFLGNRALAVEFLWNQADSNQPANLRLSLPIFVTPFNLIEEGYPSMDQSLAFTKDLYGIGHYSIRHFFGQKGLGWREWGVRGFTLVFDLAVTALPGFEAWLHEEWHRAVMKRWGIHSYNGVYDMNLGASTIPVRKVKDQDLINLKAQHPLDMIRLPEAGVEGSLELITEMEKDSFFYGSRLHNSYFYALSYLGIIGYIQSGGKSEVNDMHTESNDEEKDIKDRDFVGHDFNSWVYDLFRPGEAYEERGTHPSGSGINRYRDSSELSDEEKDYLNLQGRLSLLNLLDPFLFSMNALAFDETHRKQINFNVKHELTSFGYTVDQNIFWRADPFKLFLRIHSYFNHTHYFPGFDAEVLDYPVAALSMETRMSFRLAGWLQPKGGNFKTANSTVGGLVGLRIAHEFFQNYPFFVEARAKTFGWVAGIEYQERVFQSLFGVETTIY